MALIVKDRVRETSTTTGTGTITLAGASTGFRSFADIGNANTTYYCISNNNQFEVGIGTYTASGTTLSRDTVLSNSLGTTALIDFSAGTKDVFVTYPSDKAILGTTSAVASTGTGSVVLSDSPTITGNASFGSATVDIPSPTVNIGQGVAGVGQTVNIAQVGESGVVNIGYSEVGFTPSTTTIFGNVVLGTNFTDTITFESPTQYNQGITVSSGGISLLGSATITSNYSINNTTGTISLGGSSQTGAINLGRSTVTHTFNIDNGTLGTLATRTINIGVAGGGSSITNTTIGTTGVTGSTRSFTLFNGTIRLQTFTVANLPTGVAGSRSFVTNALAPAFGAAVAGGGAVGVPVYHDGTSWKVG